MNAQPQCETDRSSMTKTNDINRHDNEAGCFLNESYIFTINLQDKLPLKARNHV